MSEAHPHAGTDEALSAHVREEIDHWLTSSRPTASARP